MENLREMCLCHVCCGNTTSLRDRRVLESPNTCKIVPTLVEILYKAMILSDKEYSASEMTDIFFKFLTVLLVSTYVENGLLQRRMKIENLLLNHAKKVALAG